MEEEKKNKYPLLPVGIGFIGMAVPLFVAIAYAPNSLTKMCEFAGGVILAFLGILTARAKGQ